MLGAGIPLASFLLHHAGLRSWMMPPVPSLICPSSNSRLGRTIPTLSPHRCLCTSWSMRLRWHLPTRIRSSSSGTCHPTCEGSGCSPTRYSSTSRVSLTSHHVLVQRRRHFPPMLEIVVMMVILIAAVVSVAVRAPACLDSERTVGLLMAQPVLGSRPMAHTLAVPSFCLAASPIFLTAGLLRRPPALQCSRPPTARRSWVRPARRRRRR